MYDFHSHYIYGVDDGAETIEDSLQMLKEASEAGIRHMIATPHYIKGSMDTEASVNRERFDQIQKAVKEQGIEIDLYIANEVYLDIDTVEDLQTGRCLSIAKTDYVLIELPFNSEILDLENWIFSLTYKGYKPILAHPERYMFVQKDIERIGKLIEIGVLCQLNLSSLNGRYGKGIQKTAEKLLEKQYIHFVGSDVHYPNSSALAIEKPLKKIKKLCPSHYHQIIKGNGEKVIKNQVIEPFDKVKKKRKWPKRLLIGLLIFVLLGVSGGYYAFKKVEAQFEQAMIQQAQQLVAAQEAAEKKAAEEAEAKAAAEKEARDAERQAEKEARQKAQAEEDQRREEERLALEEQLKAEEAAALEAAQKAKDEAEKLAAEKAAEEARQKIEAEKKQAEEEQKRLEEERIAEEERLAAEAKAEEERLEQERLERERIIEEEKAAKEAEMAAKYTDYESDKAQALELAISKLTVDQINRLIELAAGGFEPEEKAEAKEMFYNNFTPEEQEWILEMYVKYYGS